MLSLHTTAVNIVAFSPDGKTVVTSAGDQRVRLWDVPSGKLLHTLPSQGAVNGVGFGVRGKNLFVRGNSGTLDRWDLEAIEELKKRPEPIPPDLDKSPAPEIPDVQSVGSIVAPLAVVVAPEKGCALVFTRDRLMLRYSYPAWQLTTTVWMGEHVTSAALDANKGLLYAATVPPGKLKVDAVVGALGEGDIAIYEIKNILEGKAQPVHLKPTAKVPVGANLKDLVLADGGRWLYYLSGKLPLAYSGQRLDTSTRKSAGTIELNNVQFSRMRISPDGKSVWITGRRNSSSRGELLVRVEGASAKLAREYDLGTNVVDLEAGNDLAVVAGLGTFLVCPRDGEVERQSARIGMAMNRLAPDGKRLYVVTRGRVGGPIDVCEPDDKQRFRLNPARTTITLTQEQAPGDSVWITPDGKFLIGASGQLFRLGVAGLERPGIIKPGHAEVGNPRERVRWMSGHKGRVLSIGASPNGEVVATGGEDSQLLVRRADNGSIGARKAIDPFNAGGAIYAIAFARDQRVYSLATWGGLMHTLTMPGHDFLHMKRGSTGTALDTISFFPDSSRVVSTGEKGVHLWGIPRGRSSPPDQVIPTTASLTGVTVHPESALIAAGSVDGKIRLYDPIERTEKAVLEGHTAEVRCVCYSPDGKRLASASIDGTVRIWDSASNKQLHRLDAKEQALVSLAFGPDAKLVAAGALDGSLRLWDAETGKEVGAIPARPTRPIYGLAFAPDGKQLWGAVGNEVVSWDTSGLVGSPVTPPRPAEAVIVGTPPMVTRPVEIKRVGMFRDAILDAKNKECWLLNRLGNSLLRFSYPELKLQGSVRLESSVFRIALDQKNNRFYTLRTNRKLSSRLRGPIDCEDAEVVVYDYKELLGRGKSSIPKPVARKSLEGRVHTMLLSPDGEVLYYPNKKDRQLVWLNARKLEPLGSVLLPSPPQAIALTPGGKALYVACSDGLKSTLDVYKTGEWKRTTRTPLPVVPTDLVVTDAGLVAVAGERDLVVLDPARNYATAQTLTLATPMSVGLTPNQKWFVVIPHQAGNLSIRALPAKDKPTKGVEFRVERTTGATVGGEFLFMPDGEYLLLGGIGGAVKLPAEVAGKK